MIFKRQSYGFFSSCMSYKSNNWNFYLHNWIYCRLYWVCVCMCVCVWLQNSLDYRGVDKWSHTSLDIYPPSAYLIHSRKTAGHIFNIHTYKDTHTYLDSSRALRQHSYLKNSSLSHHLRVKCITTHTLAQAAFTPLHCQATSHQKWWVLLYPIIFEISSNSLTKFTSAWLLLVMLTEGLSLTCHLRPITSTCYMHLKSREITSFTNNI